MEASPERKLELINFIRAKRKQPRFNTLDEIPDELLRGRAARTQAAAAAPTTRGEYNQLVTDATDDPEQPPDTTPVPHATGQRCGEASPTASSGHGEPTTNEESESADPPASTVL